MRIQSSLRSILPFFVLLSSALLHAQFQAPAPDELKMTTDPKAPGAAAVYFEINELTDDQLHYRSAYARIKVLTEKGKELATVEIPYLSGNFKVTSIKARTIHPDGTTIPLVGKPEDLLVVKSGAINVGSKVFNLPSVEVGSILEYRYEVHYEDRFVSSPYWRIQQPYFVHHAHYVFKPLAIYAKSVKSGGTEDYAIDSNGNVASFLLWTALLPPGVAVKPDNFGQYLVDVADVPPVPSEEWMPPIRNLLYKVSFYYTASTDSAAFWQDEARRWSKQVDQFADPSKSIREAVSTLIAPGDSDLDKARKLYKAVQALDNTDFSRKKTKAELKQFDLKTARNAEDIWSQKSGSSNDIALLYLAMLRAAGLTAHAVQVVNRDKGNFDPAFLSREQLDDDLVILSTDGKEITLDPGEKMCPFQTVHWKHSSAVGIRQIQEGRAIASLPPQMYTGNTLQRTGSLALGEHGIVNGSIRFTMEGQQALRWRQTALENDPDEVNKLFDEWIKPMAPEGIEAHVDRLLALDNPDVPLVAAVNVSGSLGVATSHRLLLPAYFFQTRGSHPFVDQATRIEPVDMQYGDVTTDQITYHLPSGLSVESAPPDAKTPWTGFAVLVEKAKVDPAQVTIARLFSRAFTLLKPEQYQDLHDFYQKVAAADQQQLVLTSTEAGKGN